MDMKQKFENYDTEMQKMQMKYDESLELSIELQKQIQVLEKQVKDS